jgi:hypothetical protein
MPFDVDNVLAFCVHEIRCFAADHQNEVFYAFAIDGRLLCLNSEEEFAKTVKKYQEDWERRTRTIESLEGLSGTDLRDVEMVIGFQDAIRKVSPGTKEIDREAALESVNESRAKKRVQGNLYHKPEVIKGLRGGTGDWGYQGFADMNSCVGFDEEAYSKHYNMGFEGCADEDLKTTEYAIAMDEIVNRLVEVGAFHCLKTTSDFYATRVEHDY